MDPARRMKSLPPGVRRDPCVLESDSRARADVVRQFHERGNDGMVEILAELEADELLREQMVLILRGLKDRTA